MPRRHVLRSRMGLTLPDGVARADIEDQITAAIIDLVTRAGGQVDLLQLGPAARPDWAAFGPIDRITNTHLQDHP
jgi:hypothetical protein